MHLKYLYILMVALMLTDATITYTFLKYPAMEGNSFARKFVIEYGNIGLYMLDAIFLIPFTFLFWNLRKEKSINIASYFFLFTALGNLLAIGTWAKIIRAYPEAQFYFLQLVTFWVVVFAVSKLREPYLRFIRENSLILTAKIRDIYGVQYEKK